MPSGHIANKTDRLTSSRFASQQLLCHHQKGREKRKPPESNNDNYNEWRQIRWLNVRRARRACDLTAVRVIPSSKIHTQGIPNEGHTARDIIESRPSAGGRGGEKQVEIIFQHKSRHAKLLQ